MVVANCGHKTSPIARANAKLIAAAPELLEACQLLKDASGRAGVLRAPKVFIGSGHRAFVQFLKVQQLSALAMADCATTKDHMSEMKISDLAREAAQTNYGTPASAHGIFTLERHEKRIQAAMNTYAQEACKPLVEACEDARTSFDACLIGLSTTLTPTVGLALKELSEAMERLEKTLATHRREHGNV